MLGCVNMVSLNWLGDFNKCDIGCINQSLNLLILMARLGCSGFAKCI